MNKLHKEVNVANKMVQTMTDQKDNTGMPQDVSCMHTHQQLMLNILNVIDSVTEGTYDDQFERE